MKTQANAVSGPLKYPEQIESFLREWYNWHNEEHTDQHFARIADRLADYLDKNREIFTHPASEGCPKGWQPIETAPKVHDELLFGWASLKPEGHLYRVLMSWFQPGEMRREDGWWVANGLRVFPRLYMAAPSIPEGE